MDTNKIKSFTDLIAWKEAHKLAILGYKLTDKFPAKETFSLTDQLRRALTSVSSNIAEGFSRKTNKDKCHFFYTALGSLTEIQNQILLARDVEYLSNEDFKKIADQTILVSKLINGLIKNLRV